MMYTVRDIVKSINMEYEIIGHEGRAINSFVPIDNAHRNGLSFCVGTDKKSIDRIIRSRSKIVICHKDITIPKFDKTLIKVENPRLAFIRFLNSVHKYKAKIHPSAIINDNVSIGKNVTIKPLCTIGFEGFSFEKNEKRELEHFPHLGGVVIEDNVSIGAGACIDRGTLSDTIIGEGTQINNLVHIGHNVITGKYSVIGAGALILGGVHIEDRAWIAPGAIIRDNTKVGRDATVGMGAVTTKNVEDEDVVIDVPARSKYKNGIVTK